MHFNLHVYPREARKQRFHAPGDNSPELLINVFATAQNYQSQEQDCQNHANDSNY